MEFPKVIELSRISGLQLGIVVNDAGFHTISKFLERWVPQIRDSQARITVRLEMYWYSSKNNGIQSFVRGPEFMAFCYRVGISRGYLRFVLIYDPRRYSDDQMRQS